MLSILLFSEVLVSSRYGKTWTFTEEPLDFHIIWHYLNASLYFLGFYSSDHFFFLTEVQHVGLSRVYKFNYFFLINFLQRSPASVIYRWTSCGMSVKQLWTNGLLQDKKLYSRLFRINNFGLSFLVQSSLVEWQHKWIIRCTHLKRADKNRCKERLQEEITYENSQEKNV